MTLPLAGQIIRASDITQYAGRYINKSGSETVTSSTTLQDDDDFVVALTPGLYRIELLAHSSGVDSTTTGGIASAWDTTGTITALGRSCVGPGFGGSSQSTTVGTDEFRSTGHGLGTTVRFGGFGGSTTMINENMLVECTVAGNLQWQWAQAVSSSTATSVSGASRMYVNLMEAY